MEIDVPSRRYTVDCDRAFFGLTARASTVGEPEIVIDAADSTADDSSEEFFFDTTDLFVPKL